jgi:hypothetical protein
MKGNIIYGGECPPTGVSSDIYPRKRLLDYLLIRNIFSYFYKVRIITIIFSFYILILSLLPCGDKSDCKDNSASHIEYGTTDHSDHPQDSETCSPFCICVCCGQTINFLSFQQLAFNINPVSEKQIIFYRQSVLQEITSAIWQPPKIS